MGQVTVGYGAHPILEAGSLFKEPLPINGLGTILWLTRVSNSKWKDSLCASIDLIGIGLWWDCRHTRRVAGRRIETGSETIDATSELCQTRLYFAILLLQKCLTIFGVSFLGIPTGNVRGIASVISIEVHGWTGDWCAASCPAFSWGIPGRVGNSGRFLAMPALKQAKDIDNIDSLLLEEVKTGSVQVPRKSFEDHFGRRKFSWTWTGLGLHSFIVGRQGLLDTPLWEVYHNPWVRNLSLSPRAYHGNPSLEALKISCSLWSWESSR